MNKMFIALSALAGVLSFEAAADAASVTLPRPGQVGFGAQGQFGTLTKSGEFGRSFDLGAGYAVRMRYRMRYERGLGLSFERHSFDARDEATADTMPRRLLLTTASAEVYQMFGTRTTTTKMLSAGVGLVQARQSLRSGETKFSGEGVGDGLLFSLGAGMERFVYQSWAIDLSTRYHALFHNGKVNHDVQFSAGVVFYAAY